MLIEKRNLQIFLLFISLNTVFAGELKKYSPFKSINYLNISKAQVRAPLIAIIDTGIDISNNKLRQSVVSGKISEDGKLVVFNNTSEINYGLDFTSSNIKYKPKDEHGHGTHIAGIINEINPNAKIIPISTTTQCQR